MKLPLSFHATSRMKEFYDFKAEIYLGAFLREASAQEATTQDIQHDYCQGFIKFLLPPPRRGGMALENSYKEQKRSQELT